MERKETEIIAGTDMNLVSEVEMQYYNVLKILIDPELEPLKSRITVHNPPHRCSLTTSPSTWRARRTISASAR
jgi:hypothetical protein